MTVASLSVGLDVDASVLSNLQEDCGGAGQLAPGDRINRAGFYRRSGVLTFVPQPGPPALRGVPLIPQRRLVRHRPAGDWRLVSTVPAECLDYDGFYARAAIRSVRA